MKVVAARSVRDGEDIHLLVDRLRITTSAGVWQIVTRYFPGQEISDRSRLLVEEPHQRGVVQSLRRYVDTGKAAYSIPSYWGPGGRGISDRRRGDDADSAQRACC